MNIFTPKVKKSDIAVFLENLSFLLDCGYTSYDAVSWVCESASEKKRDREAKRVLIIGQTMIQDLREGYALSTAMAHNPQYFGEYAKQVEAAEESNQVAQVLDQIVQNIRESSELKSKIRGAMIYPAFVLSITVAIAWYLFSFVIPDILEMMADVGGGEIPPMTQLVMDITGWMSLYALPLFFIVAAIIVVVIFLAKGPLKMQFHKLYTRLPLISRISLASNVCAWMQSLRYMLYAESPMDHALITAADSMTNIFLRKQGNAAYALYQSAGVPIPEALKLCKFLNTMEIATINVGLTSGRATEVLARLAKRRKDDTEKAIAAFTAALTPIVICILGVIVGVIMMSVYGPLINITSTISG